MRGLPDTAKKLSSSLSRLVREYSPEISFKRVVFPQPFRPTTAMRLASFISILTEESIG